MMNRKLSTLMLAAAALLASCSQDDALQNTVNNNEGLKPLAITASLPMPPQHAATCRYSMAMARNWKAAIPNP